MNVLQTSFRRSSSNTLSCASHNHIKMTTLFSQLQFDSRSLQELPVDKSYRTDQRNTPNTIFSLVKPTPLENPRLVAFSPSVCALLGISLDPEIDTPFLAGCKPDFGTTAAHCYAGHQFGYFSGQLGDGATMYLGEVISKQKRWEIQFKGAGPTPFSRQADGRKVLRSSIREFLCSEHMFALGIPTTRALSICTSDSTVVRDMLYDGHPKREPCAVIIRVCESFLRFGSFEVAHLKDAFTGRAGPSPGNKELVKTLVDYVQKHFYSSCASVQDMMMEIAQRTASLVAQWQTVGFCHGVLNTDNLSIVGVTIDYGPFGFMEQFDPYFVCNRSDDEGRYAYHAQPSVCLWNLKVLFTELTNAGVEGLDWDEINAKYRAEFASQYRARMESKLGLTHDNFSPELVSTLFRLMEESKADFTMTFRALSKCHSPEDYFTHLEPCCTSPVQQAEWQTWLKDYLLLVGKNNDGGRMRSNMDRVNPVFVLRNSVAQRAIDAGYENGDFEELNKILGFCMNPYEETEDMIRGRYHKPSRAVCQAVSCSS